MISVSEKIKPNEIRLQGKFPDILTYLEKEAERCPKMRVTEYIRLRRIEKAEERQFSGMTI